MLSVLCFRVLRKMQRRHSSNTDSVPPERLEKCLLSDFSQEDQDEGKPLLQPPNDSFELGESRGRRPGLFLGALLAVPVPLAARHVQQRGAAVVPVLEGMRRRPVVERSPLSPAGTLIPRGRHLDEDFSPSGRRAQH
ncbi:hypothetical protein EK904_013574 [Melospiza melodia maxima]|nr:hypothetical protein EK904_013574 [Melospiza melodia maxima]